MGVCGYRRSRRSSGVMVVRWRRRIRGISAIVVVVVVVVMLVVVLMVMRRRTRIRGSSVVLRRRRMRGRSDTIGAIGVTFSAERWHTRLPH